MGSAKDGDSSTVTTVTIKETDYFIIQHACWALSALEDILHTSGNDQYRECAYVLKHIVEDFSSVLDA